MAGKEKESSHGLSDLQLKFCIEYAKSLNATKAYIAAGYKVTSEESAAAGGSTLLRNHKVRTYLSEILNFNQAIAINKLVQIALAELRDVMQFDGREARLKPSSQWSDRGHAAVKSVKTNKDGTVSVEMHDPVNALARLLKMKAFQVDEPESSALDLLAKLHAMGMTVPGQVEAIGKNLEQMESDLKKLGEGDNTEA